MKRRIIICIFLIFLAVPIIRSDQTGYSSLNHEFLLGCWRSYTDNYDYGNIIQMDGDYLLLTHGYEYSDEWYENCPPGYWYSGITLAKAFITIYPDEGYTLDPLYSRITIYEYPEESKVQIKKDSIDIKVTDEEGKEVSLVEELISNDPITIGISASDPWLLGHNNGVYNITASVEDTLGQLIEESRYIIIKKNSDAVALRLNYPFESCNIFGNGIYGGAGRYSTNATKYFSKASTNTVLPPSECQPIDSYCRIYQITPEECEFAQIIPFRLEIYIDDKIIYERAIGKEQVCGATERYLSIPLDISKIPAGEHTFKIIGTEIDSGEPQGSHIHLVEYMMPMNIRCHRPFEGNSVPGIYLSDPLDVPFHEHQSPPPYPISGKFTTFEYYFADPVYGADTALLRDMWIFRNGDRLINGPSDVKVNVQTGQSIWRGEPKWKSLGEFTCGNLAEGYDLYTLCHFNFSPNIFADAVRFDVTLSGDSASLLPEFSGISLRFDKLPVLLVHGWTGSGQNWDILKEWLEKDGYKVEILEYDDSKPIIGAARELADKVAEMIPPEGQIDIIAHSYGGLVARYYIEQMGGEHNVKNLIMLGTPNHGSPLADYLTGEPLDEPQKSMVDATLNTIGMFRDTRTWGSTLDMRTKNNAFLDMMNLQYESKSISTYYHVIAGTGHYPMKYLSYKGILPGPDDGVVPLDSARLKNAELCCVALDHSSLTNPLNVDAEANIISERLETLKQLYSDEITDIFVYNHAFCEYSYRCETTDPDDEQILPELFSHVEVSLKSGESTSGDFTVAPNTAKIEVSITFPFCDFNFTLQSPDGIITPTTGENNVDFIKYNHTWQYIVRNPKAGEWTYNLVALETPENGTNVGIMIEADVVNTSNPKLKQGWNLISLIPESTETSADITLPLRQGWNMLGYSSEQDFTWNNSMIDNSGQIMTLMNASEQGLIQSSLYYYDETANMYRYVPGDDISLRPNKGYWLYAAADNLKLVLPGVGGSDQSSSFYWNDTQFNDGNGTKTLDEAQAAGWLQEIIYYFDENVQYYKYIPGDDNKIYPWRGYWVYSNKELGLIIS